MIIFYSSCYKKSRKYTSGILRIS